MRPHVSLRARAAGTALGVLSIATISAAPAAAQTPVTAKLRDASLKYGEKVVVNGRTASGPGASVALEYRAAGTGAWRSVATAKAGKNGAYRLAVRLSRSGAVRVVTRGGGAQAASNGGAAPVSAERRVAVAAKLGVSKRRLNVRAGRTATVAGSVRRPQAGRVVTLQARKGKGWRTLDRDRTDGRGRYALRYRTRGSDSMTVRVSVRGDGQNATARRSLGRLNAFRTAHASWYGPGFYGKRTACGQTFHAQIMGVAHKTLPCGTRVTFRKGSRVVQARVVDRGPFIAGREWDLSPAVKNRLGFGSTGNVQVAH
jgi:rare lipoprotein A